jgi:peptide/nickel transport system substrate-binding protein
MIVFAPRPPTEAVSGILPLLRPLTRMLMRPPAPQCVFAILVLTLFAACTANEGGSKSGAAGPTGGTLIFASPGDPGSVFPAFATEQVGGAVLDLVFDHLADISNDLTTTGDKTFSPRLAKSWTWAPDSLSITYSLDPRARWHDGKPVTAADVRYSLKVFTDPKAASPVAPLLSNVDSVSVKDSLTAVIWFKKHTPEQFYDVAYQLFIVPEHVYGSVPLDSLRMSAVARTPIGSGQFRFVQWQPDVKFELEADTANYHGRPLLDRVIFTPTTESSTRRTQVLTGQADFMQNFSGEPSVLDSSKVARPLRIPSLGYAFIGMNRYAPKSNNQAHPILSDVRVRRALSMAVNRADMLRNVFGDKGLAAHGPFPMILSASDSTVKLSPYDTAAASALLDSAGWRRGPPNGMRSKHGTPLKFSLLLPATTAIGRKYSQLLQEQYRRVGVTLDVDPVDAKTYTDRVQPGLKAGDFDMALQAFSTDPSPSGMRQNWGTAGIGPQGQNFLRYSNPKTDALIDSMSASFDPAKVRQYAARAFQQIADDAPAIWLYDLSELDAVNRRFNVPRTRADGWWRTLAEWSIPPDKRIDRDRIPLGAVPPAR